MTASLVFFIALTILSGTGVRFFQRPGEAALRRNRQIRLALALLCGLASAVWMLRER